MKTHKKGTQCWHNLVTISEIKLNIQSQNILYLTSLATKLEIADRFKFWKIKMSIIFIFTNFNIDEKSLLVPIFSDDSHFSPYILFLLLLVIVLKNTSRFSLCRYIKNRKKLTWQTAEINNTKLISTWPKLIIKNIFYHVSI